jgi:hypothetical protein
MGVTAKSRPEFGVLSIGCMMSQTYQPLSPHAQISNHHPPTNLPHAEPQQRLQVLGQGRVKEAQAGRVAHQGQGHQHHGGIRPPGPRCRGWAKEAPARA